MYSLAQKKFPSCFHFSVGYTSMQFAECLKNGPVENYQAVSNHPMVVIKACIRSINSQEGDLFASVPGVSNNAEISSRLSSGLWFHLPRTRATT